MGHTTGSKVDILLSTFQQMRDFRKEAERCFGDLCWRISWTKPGVNSSVADAAKIVSVALASVFGL